MSARCSWLIALLLLSLPARAAPPEVSRVAQAELPAGMHVVGALVTALRWTDRTGDNVAAFSREIDAKRGRARLLVELWSGKAGRGALVRSVKDGVSACALDLYADFIEEALGVTDLDADGIGELTFAYRTTCTSDVSPFTLKLLLLEQRAKYAVRGTTLVDAGGGEKVGGDKQLDAALKKQPALRKHAEAVWAKIVALSPWS